MRKRKTIFVRSVWVMLSIFFLLLFIFVAVGTNVAVENSGPINDMFNLNPYVKVQVGDSTNEDMEHYKSNFVVKDSGGNIKYVTEADGYKHQVYDYDAMRANSEKIAEQTAVEGTVLLWNNDALPLVAGECVNIYGMGSVNYVFAGMGSGALDAPNPLGGSIQQALQNKGILVNTSLTQKYEELKNKYSRAVWHNNNESRINYPVYFSVNEAPWSEVSGVTNETIAQYGDAAIMVISRTAGEDYDISENVTDQYADNSNNHLELTVQEAEVLKALNGLKKEKKLEKIILLINSANPMQFAEIQKDTYDIDACLWVGMGGRASFAQIADILVGHEEYALSGKTSDTLLKNNRSAPSYQNFGDYTWTEYSNEIPDIEKEYGTYYQTHNLKYMVYQEGIYVGYRYYETRYADYVLGGEALAGSVGSTDGEGYWNYSEEVAFPFGYGKSYTEFAHSDYNVVETNDAYQVSMTITNIGTKYAGKDVLQVYIQKPYTEYDKKNKIEKSAVELIGFAKTDLLEPNGGSQTLTITIDKECMRTYDAYGQKTYILEAGDYYIAAGTNAHDALNNIFAASDLDAQQKARMDDKGDAAFVYKHTEDKDDYEVFSKSSKTGNYITNQIDEADINIYEGTTDQKITYLSRSNWDDTFPKSAVKLKCVNETMVRDIQYGHKPGVNEGDEMPIYGKVTAPEGELTIAMLKDLEFNDPMWEDLLNQMTQEDQQALAAKGFYSLAGSETVGAPGGKASDGPAGCSAFSPALNNVRMAFPSPVVMASTWNVNLINKLGDAFGHEVMFAGNQIVYAPGADIHRSLYGGRNWEYYSEDGFLSGEMLNAETNGLVDRGIIVMAKHFAFNDQERNRMGVATFFNEQSGREIYLKAFEKAVVDGRINGLMSSFNRVGLTWMGAHKGVLTNILRDEWGYIGVVETDSCTGNTFHMQNSYARSEGLLAGNDIWMASNGSASYFDESKDNPTVMIALRKACHRILYVQLNSVAMNGMSMSTRMRYVTPWWEILLRVVEIDVGILLAYCLIMAFLSFVFATKKSEKHNLSNQKSVKTESQEYTSYKRETENAETGDNAILFNTSEPIKSKFHLNNSLLALIISGIAIIAILLTTIIIPVSNYSGGMSSTIVPECSEKCSVCGGCLDPNCTTCENICNAGDNVYSYEAENGTWTNGANPKWGPVSVATNDAGRIFVQGFAGNKDATLTFIVTATEATRASLHVTITRRNIETVFTEGVSISVNDVLMESQKTIQHYPGTWHEEKSYMDFNLGCINLNAGDNYIKFTVLKESDEYAYNFDKITLHSEKELLPEVVEESKHEYCSICGGCLDLECESCEKVCDDGSIISTFEAEDSILKDGSNPPWWGGIKVNYNAEGRTYVENLAANVGASMTFKITSQKAMAASLHVTVTRRNSETVFSEGVSVSINGNIMETSQKIPAFANEWADASYQDYNLGCINLVKGENTIVFTVLTNYDSYAYNFDKITLHAKDVVTWTI